MSQPLPTPLIDRASARELLRAAMPDWEWFLEHLEDAKGRFRFRSGVTKAIKNLKVESYPLLYENEAAMGTALALAFFSQEELKELDAEFRTASSEERGEAVREFGEAASALVDATEFPETPEQEAAARAKFETFTAEEQQNATRTVQFLLAGGLALFYEQLSLIVHGEKLSSLVAQAKSGNDAAFAKAVQIDGRILTAIPYFRDRHAKARLEDEAEFVSLIWRRQVAPPYRGRIQHKALYLMFAFLDSMGLLKLFTHPELLDLYDELGGGGKRHRIEDVKNMTKRLAEYRRFQQRRHMSTP